MLTYVVMALVGLLAFLIGLAVGLMKRKDTTIGTLILNASGKSDRPPFELHITEDPHKMETGELVSFRLEIR